MRKIAFLPTAFEDFNWWATEDRRIYARIVRLIKDIERSPFSGLGKPEPLKHELQGLWSRRITDEHRLVYKVAEEEIVIVSCRFHYQ
jgi:toxin YoeB